jgi:DNA-binding PadR family transcriptional regulator
MELEVNLSTDSLTDLEGTIMSTLLRWPGETAYFVRQSFIRSPSIFWSGSSGSIYPALRRLEGRKLLEAVQKRGGRKKSVGYTLTQTGEDACQAWIQDPVRACDTGFDPFRSRLASLDFVPEPARAGMLLAWRAEIEASFAVIEVAKEGASHSAGFDLATRVQEMRLDVIERCLEHTNKHAGDTS